MNKGWRPAEIAEAIDLPTGLAERWAVRGYYGSVSHNVKAVYQRYLSWYDANPCNLHPLPPAPAARKFVEYMGGAAAVIARARSRLRQGRVPLGRPGDEGGRLRRAGQHRGPRALRRRAGADGLPGRVGDLAQRLPLRRAGTAPRRLPAAGADRHGRRHPGRAHQRHVLRHDGDPPRSGEGCRPVDSASTGISPTATRRSCSPSATARSVIAWASGRTRRRPRSPWRAPRSTRWFWASSPRRKPWRRERSKIDGDVSRFAALFAMLDQPPASCSTSSLRVKDGPERAPRLTSDGAAPCDAAQQKTHKRITRYLGRT